MRIKRRTKHEEEENGTGKGRGKKEKDSKGLLGADPERTNYEKGRTRQRKLGHKDSGTSRKENEIETDGNRGKRRKKM